MELSAGRMVAHRYRIEALVGRGGMAEVYRAFDTRRGYPVALKVLREDLAEDWEFVRRFKAEAESLARLAHQNIVRFYSFEQDGRTAFIVMDYIAGETLRGRLFDRQGAPMSPAEALPILRQVAAALEFAHGEGIIHRDVKPGNIMLQPDGTALLADFGIAKAADAATVTTMAPGTPAYMSPEQCRGERLDDRSDVYSLAVVLYEMLAGRRPFVGEGALDTITGGTQERVRWEQMHAEPPNPRHLNPALTESIAGVLLHTLAKTADHRYLSAASFCDAFEAACTSRVPMAQVATAKAADRKELGAPAGEAITPATPGTAEAQSGRELPPQVWTERPIGRGQSRPGPALLTSFFLGFAVLVAFAAWLFSKQEHPPAAPTPPAATSAVALAFTYTPVPSLPPSIGTAAARVVAAPAPLAAAPSATATPTLSSTPSRQPTLTPTATTTQLRPQCTPPLCRTGEVFFCAGDCPGGCSTSCATPTPPDVGTPAVRVGANALNLRGGPGTNYPVVGAAQAQKSYPLSACNETGDWLRLAGPEERWVAAALVQVNRPVSDLPRAQFIPPPPTALPTLTPAPPTVTPDQTKPGTFKYPPPIPLSPANWAEFSKYDEVVFKIQSAALDTNETYRVDFIALPKAKWESQRYICSVLLRGPQLVKPANLESWDPGGCGTWIHAGSPYPYEWRVAIVAVEGGLVVKELSPTAASSFLYWSTRR